MNTLIDLNVFAEFDDSTHEPFIALLSRDPKEHAAVLVGEIGNSQVFQYGDLTFQIDGVSGDKVLGDVVFANPLAGTIGRWIRKDSPHNTLLVTERCDQLCIMCSQPPKKTHVDLFGYMEQACLLAPKDMVIGFSGGEPLLYKTQLFELLERVYAKRPDLSFHVLTNAQHFDADDNPRFRHPVYQQVLWGVPVYAAEPIVHDEIVGKTGAFDKLLQTLPIMARAGLQIELRTVLLRQNYKRLPEIAHLLSTRVPFISVWAIMQLERIGFAKNRWEEQFVDHSDCIDPLLQAMSIALSKGLTPALYNIPYCTVPAVLRPYLHQSISDWKRAYADDCATCNAKPICSGFFEWYIGLDDYKNRGPL